MNELRQEEGVQVYTGTELLLKGALEAGVSLLTGYPGSPVADFFEMPRSRRTLLEELGVVFQIANNEALAAARIHGSQMGDLKALAVMKSLGFHVASDGLALGNLAKAGTRGGSSYRRRR
jgi:indolepyruvate ferredoxin oxidoreductase